MKKNLSISLLLGFLLSVLGLYLAFRNVPFRELMAYLATINYLWVLPSLGLIVLSFVIRVLRWQIILSPSKKIDFWTGFHAVMIAFTINCILPGRVGELARPALLVKKEKIPYSTGLATVAVERSFDIAIIIALFILVYQFIELDPNIQINVGKVVLNQTVLESIVTGMFRVGAVLILGMLLICIQQTRSLIKQLISNLPRLAFWVGQEFINKLDRNVSQPLIRLIDNFAMGFQLLRSPVSFLACLGLSFLVWLLAALSYYLVALGCPGISISLFEMTAVMVIICIFIALPSVPGYWGLWEAGGIFALLLFSVPQKEAAGFTLTNHALQMLPVILIGFASAIITGVNIRRMPDQPEQSP